MGTRTLTVTEEAYERLASIKKEGESFSEVINRMTGRRDIMDFFGVLSEDAAVELERNIKESRKKHREKRRKRIEQIGEQLRG